MALDKVFRCPNCKAVCENNAYQCDTCERRLLWEIKDGSKVPYAMNEKEATRFKNLRCAELIFLMLGVMPLANVLMDGQNPFDMLINNTLIFTILKALTYLKKIGTYEAVNKYFIALQKSNHLTLSLEDAKLMSMYMLHALYQRVKQATGILAFFWLVVWLGDKIFGLSYEQSKLTLGIFFVVMWILYNMYEAAMEMPNHDQDDEL